MLEVGWNNITIDDITSKQSCRVLYLVVTWVGTGKILLTLLKSNVRTQQIQKIKQDGQANSED